jgi:hypothetical protein
MTEQISGNALIAAKRSSKKRVFEEKVAYYRRLGYSDTEIVAAMAGSREIIHPIGPLRTKKPQ